MGMMMEDEGEDEGGDEGEGVEDGDAGHLEVAGLVVELAADVDVAGPGKGWRGGESTETNSGGKGKWRGRRGKMGKRG